MRLFIAEKPLYRSRYMLASFTAVFIEVWTVWVCNTTECPKFGQTLGFSMYKVMWGCLDPVIINYISRIFSIDQRWIPESAH